MFLSHRIRSKGGCPERYGCHVLRDALPARCCSQWGGQRLAAIAPCPCSSQRYCGHGWLPASRITVQNDPIGHSGGPKRCDVQHGSRNPAENIRRAGRARPFDQRRQASSNRTGGPPASGSRTRLHAFTPALQVRSRRCWRRRLVFGTPTCSIGNSARPRGMRWSRSPVETGAMVASGRINKEKCHE